MGPVVLDASVLIAFFSSRDAHHHDATALVRNLLAQRRPLLISAVTYAEILVHALRQSNDPAIDEFLERARISIVPIDRAIAAAAARLRAFEALKLPDAITCATADACGAELATFDDQQRDRHAAAHGGHTPPERST
jgi:predicted nucleic acid-binding protein